MRQKEFGIIQEKLFALTALQKGFNVLWPELETQYDLCIEKDKLKLNIQVKATRHIHKRIRDYNCYSVMVSRGSCNKKKYDSIVDYFGIYIEPEDVWYIIPFDEIKTKKIMLNPHGRSKYNKYKNAWNLLG